MHLPFCCSGQGQADLLLIGAVCTNVHEAVCLGVLLEGSQARSVIAGEVHPGVAAIAAHPISGHLLCSPTDGAPVCGNILRVSLHVLLSKFLPDL